MLRFLRCRHLFCYLGEQLIISMSMLHPICGFSGISCKAKAKTVKFAVGENKMFSHRLR